MKEKMSDLVKEYHNYVEVEKHLDRKTGDELKEKHLRIVFYSGYGEGGIDHIDERIKFTNKSDLIKGLNRVIKMDILTKYIIKKVERFCETGYLMTIRFNGEVYSKKTLCPALSCSLMTNGVGAVSVLRRSAANWPAKQLSAIVAMGFTSPSAKSAMLM